MGLSGSVGGDFELAPAGVHKARCCKVLDLGSKLNEQFGKMIHKIMISFELAGSLMENGDPFVVSGFFTLTMHEKGNLRPFIESWRGKNFTDEEAEEFDILDVLGIPATVQIIHNEGYANIKTIMPLEEKDCLPAVKEPLSLVLSKEEFSQEVFESLSENLQEKLKATPEYKLLYEQDTEMT